jgi:hypothetical protein
LMEEASAGAIPPNVTRLESSPQHSELEDVASFAYLSFTALLTSSSDIGLV